MSWLISGPQQSGNDIDTYFRHLIEDLKVMWYNNGMQVWDEHKYEYFQLKAILFVTISDSPAARNLSGQSKKVGYRCWYCFREIDSQYLSESRKIVHMGHWHYIPMKHQFQNMKDQFDGNTEKRYPPPHLTSHEVYEIVKDVHVILGKCYRQKLTWSIWAKKRAAIKMGFEDNHDWVVNRPLREYFWVRLGHVSL
jgi:hypothetical protein